MRRLLAATAVVVIGATASTSFADEAVASGDFALTGCRVIPGEGEVIDDAAVVVKDGKIVAVGKRADVKVPRGITAIDAKGKVLTPAFVHAGTRLGLRGNGGGSSTTTDPAKTVMDELNPWLEANRWAASNGFATLGLLPGTGTIGGVGAAVRTAAAEVESMVRRENVLLRVDVTQGERFASSVAGQLGIARKDIDKHAQWKREHAKWELEKKKAEAAKGKVPKEPKEPTLSDSRAPYHAVLRGEMALFCRAGSSADVTSLAEALADDRVLGDDLRLYVATSGSAFVGAGDLLDLGATCVVTASLSSYPGTDQTVCPAVILRNAGLPVVLTPRSDTRSGLRNYTVDLATVVEAGFPVDEMWFAATAGAADLLGVGDVAGRIAKDRFADLLLWDGDPLLATTRLERVWVAGEPVEDVR
jgi:imidazolonepropionase-like amidohydrolase